MDDFCVTRKSLILRASDPKDHSAFEEFVKYYDPFISVVIHKMNVLNNDFEDLKQDLLIKLWKKLSMYNADHENASFRGWLSTVIRNGIYEYFRKKNRGKSVELTDELEKYCDSENSNELSELIEDEWKNHVIKIATEHLSQLFTGHAMEVFQMTMDGAGAPEIADKLQIRESSVYNLRSRVKDKFQQELKAIRELLEFPGEDKTR